VRVLSAATERARELVMSHGWNSTCCQILYPGMQHWFSASKAAVVGYVRRGDVLLAAGAPVCEEAVLGAVCREFELFATELGCKVCYVCAEDRLRRVFAGSANHTSVAIGAQPVWDPRQWPRITQTRASLRAQLSRSRNKGVGVEMIPTDEAASHPELRRVLHNWLDSRGLPPFHFLVEPDVLSGIPADRVVLAAMKNNKPVAYLVASPIEARKGYQVELLARSNEAPNGTTEMLIDAAMLRFADEDRSFVTLGLVALARAADDEIQRNPLWLRSLMRFARAHANRFYRFQGLEQFRRKMAPRAWEPVFAISNERRFSPWTLYNMGAAFAGIPPWQAIGIGIAKAARQELHRAFRVSGLVGRR
jgi:phosphatidylglycerol lysyltransferase